MEIFSYIPSLPYGPCGVFLENYGDLMAKYPGIFPEKIWFTEHPKVYTLGPRSSPHHRDMLEKIFPEVPCVETKRGGEITFHGPGQLMIYPCLSLVQRELCLRDYVKILENWVARALKDLGCSTIILEDHPGLWIGSSMEQMSIHCHKDHEMPKKESQKNPSLRKIMSLGLRVSRGIVTYGAALNVSVELSYFNKINPCGLPENSMTSLAQEGFIIDFPSLLTSLHNTCDFFPWREKSRKKILSL